MKTNVEELRSQLARYRSFLAQDANNLSLVGDVADLHLRLGEYAPARELLEQALARSPSQPALLSRLASVAMASGDHDTAIRVLSGLIESGQADPVIRYNLAYAYLYAKQPENTKQELQKIEKLDENFPQASLLLARAEHYLGEMDGALNHVQKYLERNPEDNEARGILALINLDSNNTGAARVAAEQALAASEKNLSALITLGSLSLQTQDAETANNYFEKAVEYHPNSGRSWSGKGFTDMLRLDIDKALEDFNHAVRYMPDHIGTWHALAWCYIIKNDLKNAEASFQSSMEIDRSFGETHGGMAVIHVLQNRQDQAESAIKRALRLDRNSFSARFAQTLLVEKTDPQKAREMIKEILSKSPIPGGDSLQATLERFMKNRPSAGKKSIS